MDVRLAARADADRAGRRDPRGDPAQPRHRRRSDPALAWAVGAQRGGRGGRGNPGRGVPGETFVYRFRAEQPGTYWYHTHQHGREGIARGLYGALVVQPAAGLRWLGWTSCCRSMRSARSHPGRSDKVQRDGGGGRHAGPAPVLNTDQQPRRFALNGAVPGGGGGRGRPERADRAERSGAQVPAGGRDDLAFTMPAKRSACGRGGPAGGAGAGRERGRPRPGREVPTTTFDPTTYGTPQPVPEMTAGSTWRPPWCWTGCRGWSTGSRRWRQTVNGGVYPDIPPIMVAEGDLVRMRVVNRSFETHPMHPHGHHVLVLSVNGRAPPAARSGWTPSTCSPARSGRSRCAPTTPASGWTTATT